MRYKREGPSLYVGVGEQIMLARRRAGLTQRDLGGRLGVSHVAVGDIERGKTKPNLDHLMAIACALGIPLPEIVVLERRRPPTTGSADGSGGS